MIGDIEFFYINLKGRVQRQRWVETQLTRLGVPYKRFEGIRPTPESLQHGQYQNFFNKATSEYKELFYSKNEQMVKRSLGVFGCYISHYELHKTMKNNKRPYIVLEDDVRLGRKGHPHPNLLENIYKFMNDSDISDWDMLRSMWDSTNEIKKIENTHYFSNFSTENSHNIYGGAHFTIVRCANKLINYLDSECLYAVDAVFTTNRLNVYHTSLGIETKWMGSDIPKTISLK